MLSSPVDPRAALDSANESDLVQKKLAVDAMRKRVSGGPSEEAKLREACEGFESIFLQKMWEQMRKNVKKEGYLHSKDEEAYQSMFDVELAKKMASAGGIGLADMLYEQLGQKLHNASKTTGSGLARTPLPIEPASAPKPETPKPAAPPQDLYSETPEADAAVAGANPPADPLAAVLDELAASRDPALDPANANFPMFDMQTGAPMNPVADKMKADSKPRREIDPVPMPERVSAPGRIKPSHAIGAVRRSSRGARRAASASAERALRQQTRHPALDRQRDEQAAQAAPAAQAAQNAPAPATPAPATPVPGNIQAAPGAIPASTEGPPALGGVWPVSGDVVSSYGRQPNAAWNTGVTLAAAPASPVTAPADGTVSFAGERDGLGQMVIAHTNGLTSHYFNVTPGLAPGDAVTSGMEIAKITAGNGIADAGTTGDASLMRFEVRRGELAINPENILA